MKLLKKEADIDTQNKREVEKQLDLTLDKINICQFEN